MARSLDIHTLLPFKTNDEFDSSFSFRAIIHSDFTYPDGAKAVAKTLFPPYQLRTVEHKADFNRLLTAELADLRNNGVTVHKVVVEQGGKPLYDFVP